MEQTVSDELEVVRCTLDLSEPCRLPFRGARNISAPKSETVDLEFRDGKVFQDGREIVLFLSEEQKKGLTKGFEILRLMESTEVPVSAKLLDLFLEREELWPEEWKRDGRGRTLYVFFWGDLFGGLDRNMPFVRCGYWDMVDRKVREDTFWLCDSWNGSHPATVLKKPF